MDEPRLFEYAYGSILVESVGELDFPAAELLGAPSPTTPSRSRACGCRSTVSTVPIRSAIATIYPDKG